MINLVGIGNLVVNVVAKGLLGARNPKIEILDVTNPSGKFLKALLQKTHFISDVKEILPLLHKRGNERRPKNLSFYPLVFDKPRK